MSENPYALGSQAAAERDSEHLAGARALMRHRVFALMHAAVVVLLLTILGTVLRSGGLSQATIMPVTALVLVTLYMSVTVVWALRAKPLSLPMGVFADLVTLCSCVFTLPAIWSLALRFGSKHIHKALLEPPPLSAWSPHWPTLVLLPLLTALNMVVPLILAVGMAL